ncbi:MAG: hypothetical protein QXD77_01495, partial [Candidatus Aenigmatarchaeota archaeon]
MPEKDKMKTAWGRNLADEIKEIEGEAALYAGNLRNMIDAQKAAYNAMKAELDEQEAALNRREENAKSYVESEMAKINQARAELDAKYPVLDKREKELAEKEARYNTERAVLDQTASAVAEKSKQMEEREKALEAREAELDSRYTDLAAKEKGYAERDATLSEKMKILDGKDAMLKRKEAELAAKEAELAAKEAELKKAYKEMEANVAEISAGIGAKKYEPPAEETRKALGGDVEKPTAERLTRKVKKLSIGDNKPTAAAAQAQAPSVPQAAEDVLYKHEFPVEQQNDVMKALKGFDGVESSKLTGEKKYSLASSKADEKRGECDYSYNKGSVRVEFTTKNPAVEAALKAYEEAKRAADRRKAATYAKEPRRTRPAEASPRKDAGKAPETRLRTRRRRNSSPARRTRASVRRGRSSAGDPAARSRVGFRGSHLRDPLGRHAEGFRIAVHDRPGQLGEDRVGLQGRAVPEDAPEGVEPRAEVVPQERGLRVAAQGRVLRAAAAEGQQLLEAQEGHELQLVHHMVRALLPRLQAEGPKEPGDVRELRRQARPREIRALEGWGLGLHEEGRVLALEESGVRPQRLHGRAQATGVGDEVRMVRGLREDPLQVLEGPPIRELRRVGEKGREDLVDLGSREGPPQGDRVR